MTLIMPCDQLVSLDWPMHKGQVDGSMWFQYLFFQSLGGILVLDHFQQNTHTSHTHVNSEPDKLGLLSLRNRHTTGTVKIMDPGSNKWGRL